MKISQYPVASSAAATDKLIGLVAGATKGLPLALLPAGISRACTLEQFGAVGNDAVADQAAFASALAALRAGTYTTLLLGAKTYLVQGTTDPTNTPFPFGVSIFGQGASSILKTTTNGPVILMRDADAGDRAKSTTLAHFKIEGNSTGGNQNGIEIGYVGGDGSSRIRLVDITAENMGGRGFSLAYGGVIGTGIQAIGCRAIHCVTRGFSLHDQVNCIGCQVIGGVYGTSIITDVGVFIDGVGNVVWNGDVGVCNIGIDIAAGGNDGHGIIFGSNINHNTTAIRIGALINGMTISACHFYQGHLTVAANTGLIEFDGCVLDITTYNFTDSLVKFANCRADQDYLSAYNETGDPDVEWLNCREVDEADGTPSFIRDRVQKNYTFPSDANQTLSKQVSRAETIVIQPGVTTAPRTVSSAFTPLKGRKQRVVNLNAQTVQFKWFSGTGLNIPPNGAMVVGADGTNAMQLP